MLSIVTYFAPFLGLLGLLNHFQAEKIYFDLDAWTNFNNVTDGLYQLLDYSSTLNPFYKQPFISKDFWD